MRVTLKGQWSEKEDLGVLLGSRRELIVVWTGGVGDDEGWSLAK